MGRISDRRENGITSQGTGLPGRFPSLDTERNTSRRIWREVFAGDNKEESKIPPSVHDVLPAANARASSVSGDLAFVRLLEAMRSRAPGGWSDDRWEQSKHFTGMVYICVHRMSEQLAQSEFQVYIKDPHHPGGKRPVTPDDPPQGPERERWDIRPYDLVRVLEKPNPEDSFGDMMYRWNQQMDLTGMALTWMVPNMGGVPFELYSIPTAIAIPQPVINPLYPNGYYRIQPVYPYGPFSSYPTPATSVGAPIPGEWMLNFKYPHPLLRYDGWSPLTALRLHIDETEEIDRSRWYKMKRSVNPDATLDFDMIEGMVPLQKSERDRLREDFANFFQGSENAGRLFIGSPGAKLNPWGIAPKDMDYPNGWDQLTSFVMAGMGITKPAAGIIEESSYASLYAALKQLHLLTLEPKCNRIAAKLTRFLAPFYGDNLIVEIRVQRIDDHDVKLAKLGILCQYGAITINQLLRELDMPVTSEPWGMERCGMPPMPPMMDPAMMGGDPSMMGGEQANVDPNGMPLPPMLGGGDEMDMVPPEIEAERPRPGNMGKGSLGPRGAKHLYGSANLNKLFARRNAVFKALTNVHGAINNLRSQHNGGTHAVHRNGSAQRRDRSRS